MDQDIEIINSQTRNQKIKEFFINYRNYIISALISIFLLVASFFIFEEINERKKIEVADKYNSAVINYKKDNSYNVIPSLKEIINSKDKTYTPLAFFFLLENDLINSKNEINQYFDLIIDDLNIDKKFKELTIYKKGLYNSEYLDENELLNILNPLIKSDSMWKPHSLYLMAEYYLANNQRQKSKDFFEQLVELKNANPKIKSKAQKRLRSVLVIKIYLFIFIFIFLSSCGGDKEIIQNKKQINLFEKNKIINSELNTSLKINLSTFVNNSFLNNNINNNGNIIFDTEFDKKKIFKFKKIDGYSVFDPELIFTQDGNIIFFDGNGSIFKIDEEMKELWKVNHYSKKQRRLKPKLFFASDKKRLIISDSLSQIYSVNIDNGELIWKKYSDSSFNSNIVLSSDKIMVLDFDNVIRCFSLENGKELWKFKTIDVFIKSEKNYQ